jgi:hypothetical protein
MWISLAPYQSTEPVLYNLSNIAAIGAFSASLDESETLLAFLVVSDKDPNVQTGVTYEALKTYVAKKSDGWLELYRVGEQYPYFTNMGAVLRVEQMEKGTCALVPKDPAFPTITVTGSLQTIADALKAETGGTDPLGNTL